MDTENLFKSLNDHKVDYVVIGATAFPVHGYSRTTLDIDIFIRPTMTNASRARQALVDFGYDVTDLTVEEILSKKILIRQYILETDLHPFVKGVTFDRVWKNRVKNRIGGTEAFFASLDDLIAMKEAAGRPRDREDLKVLRRLKNKQ